MNSFLEAMSAMVGTLKLWPGAMEQALLYWPGIIAALSTVTICTMAAFSILDASRRTAAVPGWSYLQRAIGGLAAERDSTHRVVEALVGERDRVREELELLKREKLRLETVRQERQKEEKALADVSERLKKIAQDRKKVDALRTELEKLQAEHASRAQSVIALREEQNERQAALESRRARLSELEEDTIKIKAARDALAGEVAQRKLESDSYQRQAQQYNLAVQDAKKTLREAEDKLREVETERDRCLGEMRVIQGRVGQLEAERRDIDDKIVAAQAARTKVAQENGRLEADRSTLWVEFLALQEKRNAANADVAVSETKVRDLRHQRDALHGEIEMLRRVIGGMEAKSAPPVPHHA
jgi:chromosome segregation ATPase